MDKKDDYSDDAMHGCRPTDAGSTEAGWSVRHIKNNCAGVIPTGTLAEKMLLAHLR